MIKKTVAQLVKRHRTYDPFALADLMNIHVVFEPLGEILGYFTNYKRFPIILINVNLGFEMQRYTCAHELGHRILHPKVNVPFLAANTFQSIDKIERQANQFAVELLIPDELLMEGKTIYEVARICGVPQEVAHLKQLPSQGFLKDERSFMNW